MAASPPRRARPSGRCWSASRRSISTTRFYEGGVCDPTLFCTGSTPAQTVEKARALRHEEVGQEGLRRRRRLQLRPDHRQVGKKYVQDNGGEVVRRNSSRSTSRTFGPTIKKIEAAKPDFVMSALVGRGAYLVLPSVGSGGLNKSIPLASTGFGNVGGDHACCAGRIDNGTPVSFAYFEERRHAGQQEVRHRSARQRQQQDQRTFRTDAPDSITASICGPKACQEGRHHRADCRHQGTRVDPISIDGPSGKLTVEPKTTITSLRRLSGGGQRPEVQHCRTFSRNRRPTRGRSATSRRRIPTRTSST